jgi:glycosyltransferase involved in cell wall biosynthesis
VRAEFGRPSRDRCWPGYSRTRRSGRVAGDLDERYRGGARCYTNYREGVAVTFASKQHEPLARDTSSRVLRVGVVNKYARVTGGADRNCLDLARLLRARGHAVRFLATDDAANVEDDGIFVESRVTHETRDALGWRQRSRVAVGSVWNAEAAAAMERLVKEFEPDVIHAHKLLPTLSLAPIAIARRHGVPVLQTLHDYELASASALDARGWIDHRETRYSYRALNSFTYPIRRIAYRRLIDAAVTCSSFMQGVYRAHGINCAVLPYFVSGSRTNPREFADREGVVFVSRLAPEKGVADVIELARAVKRVPVTIVGNGTLARYVSSAAQELPNLRFCGWLAHDAVQDTIARARVLAMPSRWDEPGGISALEAMAMGTPVVAYARGGLQEYVGSGGGRVVQESTANLIGAVLDLHDDEENWAVASAEGPEVIRSRHAPERYVAAIEDICRSLVVS